MPILCVLCKHGDHWEKQYQDFTANEFWHEVSHQHCAQWQQRNTCTFDGWDASWAISPFITLTFSLPLYFLDAAHLDSPCSSDRFPCHTGLAQLIEISYFKIILNFFTACKKKIEVCNFVPTCQQGIDEEKSLFEFFWSESHHHSLMYFNTQKFSQVFKGKLYFLILLLSGLKQKVSIFLQARKKE